MNNKSIRRPKRPRNPEELRLRKLCRAYGIPWADAIATRNRLQAAELEQREHEDAARQAGWSAYVVYSGWSLTHRPYWRSGFQRYVAPKMARGADLTSIPRYDEIADAVREAVESYRGWSTEDIWDLLLSDYKPLRPVAEHYRTAVSLLLASVGELDSVPF